ncbi:diaminopimelate epimerase [Alphaproteobacteria bacterium HT1-32]|nr:diaminopimelate epimerase [Alphaproteobacteria bacterium HT1-32]
MNAIPFTKMHGLGNDFVVLDARDGKLVIGPEEARAIGDRRTGVGFDQLLILEPARDEMADVFMRIRNPDGSEAGACGNGTRCVAAMVMDESGADHLVIETIAGLLDAEATSDGRVCVDMGPARLDWREVPISDAVDTLHIPVASGPLSDAVGVNMGNPHAVFFVEDVAKVDLAIHGPILENHAQFPDRANIGVVQIIDDSHIRYRVWERGAGITRACGSGACAAAVAAHRRGLTGREVSVRLDGGVLDINWMPDGHVMMTGPVATSFSGLLSPDMFARSVAA